MDVLWLSGSTAKCECSTERRKVAVSWVVVWAGWGGERERKGPELWVKGEESPCASFRMGAWGSGLKWSWGLGRGAAAGIGVGCGLWEELGICMLKGALKRVLCSECLWFIAHHQGILLPSSYSRFFFLLLPPFFFFFFNVLIAPTISSGPRKRVENGGLGKGPLLP